MKLFNKRILIIFSIFLFVQVHAFSGSFYTATLYPKENTNDVKKILKGKKYFICSKAEEYNLITEEKMDEQNTSLILDFVKRISSKTEKPIVSYLIHDSDILWFVVFKNGKQIFLLDNTDEYFSGGNFILKGKEKVPTLFNIDANKWKAEISKEKFEECIFSDDYLLKILDILKLPNWVVGIGYTYLSEDKDFISELEKIGINIERY
ncbi:MAG: hypothetical protein K6F04_00010 [bacterium]|nr:hypothetical protein [bacterium]